MRTVTQRLPLADTGLLVSPVCVGHVEDPATIRYAFDAGINFFFVTADMHWPAYESMRVGLAELLARRPSVRDEIVVAGVSYVAQREFLTAPFEELIDAVPGLGTLDVLVAGGAREPDLLGRRAVLCDHVGERFAGAVAVGVSCHDRAAARVACERQLVDVVFGRYNAAHTGAMVDLFPFLDVTPRPPYFNFTSTFGWLPDAELDRLGIPRADGRPTITDHYRFVMTRPQVDGILCAPATPQVLRDMLDAVARGPLSAADEQYLIKLALLASGRAVLADGA